jgi:NAD(P)-dependent dehydrogenase (short-subunit alcohol dehydrogenase family)
VPDGAVVIIGGTSGIGLALADTAGAAHFALAASPASSFITGAVIPIDGGHCSERPATG